MKDDKLCLGMASTELVIFLAMFFLLFLFLSLRELLFLTLLLAAGF